MVVVPVAKEGGLCSSSGLDEVVGGSVIILWLALGWVGSKDTPSPITYVNGERTE